MLKFNIHFTKFLLVLMILSLIFSSLPVNQVEATVYVPPVTNTVLEPTAIDGEDQLTPADLEELAALGINMNEFEDMVEVLETTFGNEGLIYDEVGLLKGMDDEYFDEALGDNPYYNDILSNLEKERLLESQYSQLPSTNYPISAFPIIPTDSDNRFITLPKNPGISPDLAACAWYGMKNKPSYIQAENNCLASQLKGAFNYLANTAMLANLIAAGAIRKAALEIAKLAVKSNLAGIIVTVSLIRIKCIRKMEALYPGKTNCVSRY